MFACTASRQERSQYNMWRMLKNPRLFRLPKRKSHLNQNKYGDPLTRLLCCCIVITVDCFFVLVFSFFLFFFLFLSLSLSSLSHSLSLLILILYALVSLSCLSQPVAPVESTESITDEEPDAVPVAAKPRRASASGSATAGVAATSHATGSRRATVGHTTSTAGPAKAVPDAFSFDFMGSSGQEDGGEVDFLSQKVTGMRVGGSGDWEQAFRASASSAPTATVASTTV